MRKLWMIPALACLVMPLATSQAAFASTHPTIPNPGQITIKVVTVNGSGCPKGTAATAVAPDATAFTVTYSSYLAEAGGNSPPTALYAFCQLDLSVHVPSGFTYAIASADYRGFGDLASGATGTEQANYYFQGDPQTGEIPHSVAGPYLNDWEFTDSTPVASLVWKPCGANVNFNVNTQLLVNLGTSNPSTVSFMEMDSTDGSITTQYNFAWKTCPSSGHHTAA